MTKNDMYARKELLQKINEVSFAVNDITSYLDTHPCDEKALAYYEEMSEMREKALQEYARLYGPLTIDTGNDSDLKSWQWMEQPFPWEQEGGCR